jgi:hypothetical protein
MQGFGFFWFTYDFLQILFKAPRQTLDLGRPYLPIAIQLENGCNTPHLGSRRCRYYTPDEPTLKIATARLDHYGDFEILLVSSWLSRSTRDSRYIGF